LLRAKSQQNEGFFVASRFKIANRNRFSTTC
jgi:hypothetical protein